MKKIILVAFTVLTVMANHLNSQADPVTIAKIKQQLKDIEAEQEKLVLSIKGAAELIKRGKALQQKWETLKSAEQVKLENELQKLQIKACIAEKTNPEIKKMQTRLLELRDIIHNSTEDERSKLGTLRKEIQNLENTLPENRLLWSDEQKKAHADLKSQFAQIDKQIEEKTQKQYNSEMRQLSERYEKLSYETQIMDLSNKINTISILPITGDKLPHATAETEKFVDLIVEFNRLIKPIANKNKKFNKKYMELLEKLPAEEQCAFERKDIYGGLMLFRI